MALSDLPLDSGKAHAKVLCRLGWVIRKNDTHIILAKDGYGHLSVPNHAEVKRPTLKRILAVAGISDDEYRDAYDRFR